MYTCRICYNSEHNITHRFREMMFGTRDEFDYIECANCGTIQLLEIPDLAKYYPENYYSFESGCTGFSDTWSSRFAARQAAKYLLKGRGLVGKTVVETKPWAVENFPPFLIEPSLGLTLRSRILDVGCGTGKLLNVLSFYGFEHLTGTDFFVSRDIEYGNGVKIFKRELHDLKGEFDLVMFHHSLEHFVDPRKALEDSWALVKKGGWCLVRIPIVAYAWKKYGKDWVQLDAPRHINLFTEKGFSRLAEETGFEVAKVVYDSTAFQFSGSEQYLKDIPLEASFENLEQFISDHFGKEQLSEWADGAKELNARGEGDQACFYLKKA